LTILVAIDNLAKRSHPTKDASGILGHHPFSVGRMRSSRLRRFHLPHTEKSLTRFGFCRHLMNMVSIIIYIGSS